MKNGYAVIYNKQNEKAMNTKLKVLNEKIKEENKRLTALKHILEKYTLTFKLKVFNGITIGSISTKSVAKKISSLDIHIPKHSLQHVEIKNLGQSEAIIKLNKEIIARIKINVIEEKNV
jgi:ribosomal protein L9